MGFGPGARSGRPPCEAAATADAPEVPADGAAGIVRRFIESLNLPTRLSEVGVRKEDFPALARDAMQDMIVATNPRPVADEAEVVQLLEKAY